MRWNKPVYQSPRVGDTRIVKRFLLFPKTLNEETRWLEWAEIMQGFSCFYSWDEHTFYWEDLDWLSNIEETKDAS